MARILFILTSHAQLGASGHATGVWLEEFTTPFYELLDAGHELTLATPRGGGVPVDPRSRAPEAQTASTRRFADDPVNAARITTTAPLAQLRAPDFDAVFVPGGHGPMWDLATDPVSGALIGALAAAGKPVAAVCHGVAALLPARTPVGRPLVEGRKLTGFSDAEERAVGLEDVVPFLLQDRLVSQGAIYSEAPHFAPHTVVDGGLVTGQNPSSAQGTAQALARLLA